MSISAIIPCYRAAANAAALVGIYETILKGDAQ